jgi:hypothetical protein
VEEHVLFGVAVAVGLGETDTEGVGGTNGCVEAVFGGTGGC